MPRPELSVVVAADDRPLRLRWLLNALEQQTLEGLLWEVVVGHDQLDAETASVLADHPLRSAGRLRSAGVRARGATRGAMRNAAVEATLGSSIVFTEPGCRPPGDWLAAVLEATRRHPGAIVQGPVRRDPAEETMMRSPFPRTHEFQVVPRLWAEAANIVYPRELLLRAGGFAEDLPVGEDTDLALRCRAIGAQLVGDPSMRTYGAIDEGSLLTRLAEARRLAGLPALARRHPELRRHLPLRVFLKRSHAWLPLALAAARLERRNPLWAALIAPWAIQYEFRPLARGRIRDVIELPGRVLIDLAETAALAAGSIRHRSPLL